MENVYGLAYRNQSAAFFEALRDSIMDLGYSFTAKVINAADHGVPQNRQRLFIIGSRDGMPLRLPQPTHWGEHERRKPPANVASLRPHITVGEALKRLVAEPEPEEVVGGKYGHLLAEIPPGGKLPSLPTRGAPQPAVRVALPLLDLPPQARPESAGSHPAGPAGTLRRTLSLGHSPAPGAGAKAAPRIPRPLRSSQGPAERCRCRWATRSRPCLERSSDARSSLRPSVRRPQGMWCHPRGRAEPTAWTRGRAPLG